ncbi:LysR family transcriptional regulator [Paraburkholderia jirisanensis]
MRLLEEELGAVLLIREPKTVKLTREGAVLYRHATRVLRQVRELSSELADMKSELRGELRVGLPPLVGSTFFSDVIAGFRRQFPAVELHIAEIFSSRLESALHDGEIDIAAAMLPVDTERFVTQPFAQDKLMFVTVREHKLAAQSALRMLALKTEPLVTFTEEFKLCGLIEDACRAQGFKPMIVGRSGHLDLVLAMVASGMGITILPSSVFAKVSASQFVAIPIVKPAIPFELALVRTCDGHLSHGCKAWIEVAASVLDFKVSRSFVSQTGGHT